MHADPAEMAIFFDIESNIENIVNNLLDVYNSNIHIDIDNVKKCKSLELDKLDKLFAQFHDKSIFDVVFFVPEPKQVIMKSKEARHNIRVLENFDSIQQYTN